MFIHFVLFWQVTPSNLVSKFPSPNGKCKIPWVPFLVLVTMSKNKDTTLPVLTCLSLALILLVLLLAWTLSEWVSLVQGLSHPSREPVDEVLQIPPSLLTCGGCQQNIGDRYFLKAIDQYWHEDCLSCDLCGCRLGEVGRRLYYKLGRKLCRRDYLRLFGQDGLCASCEKRIRAYEMTMRVKDKVYHLECFKCAACQKHFCVGDRYLLINSDIVCEQDIYEWTKINGMI